MSASSRAAWMKAQDEAWQNPSSLYRSAARVRNHLESATARLSAFLGAEPARIVYTSGATESINAVCQYLARVSSPTTRIAVNPTEHPAVLEAIGAAFEGRIEWLTLDANGVVEIAQLESRLEKSALAGVVVMAANNETGVLQPWAEIAEKCRRKRVPYLCDASQWLGKLPAAGLGNADWVFASAHKFGGPKGCGLLIRAGDATGFQGQRGGAQQRGQRGGTEDFPAISAMVAALTEIEERKVLLETERLLWREAFERALPSALPGTQVVGTGAERLWNTVSLIMPHSENQRWVLRLDKRGFQVSTGSACATGKEGPSHVLAALSVPAEAARRVIRISSGWETTQADWLALLEAMKVENGSLAEGI